MGTRSGTAQLDWITVGRAKVRRLPLTTCLTGQSRDGPTCARRSGRVPIARGTIPCCVPLVGLGQMMLISFVHLELIMTARAVGQLILVVTAEPCWSAGLR